jgi:AraC-like DNA-binding protein
MNTVNITAGDAEKIQIIKTVLEKQYFKHFTQQDLAQMVGTNESKLRSDFKELIKKTIYAFQTDLRIEKAKDLLENSSLSLKVIAVQVGLDQSNLAKTFKRSTGFTPRQWRINNRKNGLFYSEDS